MVVVSLALFTIIHFKQTLLIVTYREIFFVQEPVLVVPKLYVNIQSCTLRVIDNDSGEQLPMVFMRVKPRVLQKNKVTSVVFAIFH